MFKIGDKVLTPSDGIGVITRISSKGWATVRIELENGFGSIVCPLHRLTVQ